METSSTGLPAADVAIVRELAAKVADLAALPVQQVRIREWQTLNGLRPERPMAMIDELPWHELAAPGAPGGDELALRATHPFARQLEERLRQQLYRWDHLRVDMVINPFMDILWVARRRNGFTTERFDRPRTHSSRLTACHATFGSPGGRNVARRAR